MSCWGTVDSTYDPELVGHAANAVFHYFKHELGYQTVTLGEFAAALEKVLDGFNLSPRGDSGAGKIDSGIGFVRSGSRLRGRWRIGFLSAFARAVGSAPAGELPGDSVLWFAGLR